MDKLFSNIEKYVLYIVLVLFPVFVLSNNSSPYVVSKYVLLISGLSVLLLVFVLKVIAKGTLTWSVGKFDLGVFALGLSYLLSTLFRTPNKMEAYLVPGTTTFVLAGVVLYFMINQYSQRSKNLALHAVFISGLLVALAGILASLNLFSKIPQLPQFVKDTGFNPLGGVIPGMLYLFVVLFLGISQVIKEKDLAKKMFYGASLGVILVSLAFFVYSSFPGRPNAPRFVSMQDSWEIAVDSLKKSPILGYGPANYLTAFNLLRPVTYNQSDLWQVRFTTAANYYFVLITENGFFGLFAISVLFIGLYRFVVKELKFAGNLQDASQTIEKLSIVVLFVLFALLPVSPALLVLMFVLLAVFSGSEHKTSTLKIASVDSQSSVASRVPAIILTFPVLVGVAYVLYFGTKALAAESTFKKSLDALNRNDAKLTYELMNKAVNQNPAVDRYHASFAQLNMALATSLASKKDITESDRATITQLVQQAISEGKATVSLNPSRSGNWEVLGQIYRSIMPFAQGSDQFAIQTYSQAIALDPTNPNLRISLGGIYYSLSNFDSAIEAFKMAVIAKPDLANAHYNLAIAYREKKDYENAINEINNVIRLVDKDSQDYKLAQKTLEELQSKRTPKNSPEGTETLTPPEPTQKSNIKPPIELPKEATPPAASR